MCCYQRVKSLLCISRAHDCKRSTKTFAFNNSRWRPPMGTRHTHECTCTQTRMQTHTHTRKNPCVVIYWSKALPSHACEGIRTGTNAVKKECMCSNDIVGGLPFSRTASTRMHTCAPPHSCKKNSMCCDLLVNILTQSASLAVGFLRKYQHSACLLQHPATHHLSCHLPNCTRNAHEAASCLPPAMSSHVPKPWNLLLSRDAEIPMHHKRRESNATSIQHPA